MKNRKLFIEALASALRWYALNEHKRLDDHQDAAMLADLLQLLLNKEAS